MALPTKNDPMLAYLTTAFQDHVRVRERFGYKVDDRMWAFFQRLGVIDADGRPTGPLRRSALGVPAVSPRRGTTRGPTHEILADADAAIARVRARGVFVATGHGTRPSDMDPALGGQVRRLYEDAKVCIRAPLPAGFAATLASPVAVTTRSRDRDDYILHPPAGELLDEWSAARVTALRDAQRGAYELQIVVADGLNALALTDTGHLAPYLTELRRRLRADGFRPAPEHLVVTNGRVRAGYRIGETLFTGLDPEALAAIVHVIGEQTRQRAPYLLRLRHEPARAGVGAPRRGRSQPHEGDLQHRRRRARSDPRRPHAATVALLQDGDGIGRFANRPYYRFGPALPVRLMAGGHSCAPCRSQVWSRSLSA